MSGSTGPSTPTRCWKSWRAVQGGPSRCRAGKRDPSSRSPPRPHPRRRLRPSPSRLPGVCETLIPSSSSVYALFLSSGLRDPTRLPSPRRQNSPLAERPSPRALRLFMERFLLTLGHPGPLREARREVIGVPSRGELVLRRHRIEVALQVGGIEGDGRAGLGDLDAGGPEDPVRDKAAHAFEAPRRLEVAAREDEGAAAAGALVRPGHDVLGVLQDRLGRRGAEEGREPLEPVDELQLVDEPVVFLEGGDAPGDRMLDKRAEVAVPVTARAGTGNPDAADQRQQALGVRLRVVDDLVQMDDADPLGGEPLDPFQATGREDGLFAATVHVEDDGLRMVEDGFVLRPSLGGQDREDARGLLQEVEEDDRACEILVFAAALAEGSCKEDDLVRGGIARLDLERNVASVLGGSGKQGEEEGEGVHERSPERDYKRT